MNVGAIVLLLLVAAAAVVGTTMVFAKLPSGAPVDSFGVTTGLSENLTRSNVTSLAPVGTSAAGGIVLIIGFLIVVAAVIFFVAVRHNIPNGRSRY